MALYSPSSSSTPHSPYYPSRDRFFPPKGASESEILAYRDRVINRWSIQRNQHMGRIALSMWYYLGKQWAELDPEVAFDGIRGAIVRDISGNNSQPRPVTNEISPAVEAEVIALVKRQWIPKITPTSNDPRIKAAAQVANDSLEYRLEQLSWPEKRVQLALNFTIGGTGLLYTGWDRTYSDLHPVGAPTAVFCRTCSKGAGEEQPGMGKFYSPVLDASVLREAAGRMPMPFVESAAKPLPPEAADDQGNLEDQVELMSCPMCGGGLEPYSPTEDEIGNDKIVDPFNRPLSIFEPRGSSALEVDLPFEFYPQDGGVRVTPDTLRRWGRRKIRSLEWLEERAPHVVSEIPPDSISDLLYDDPLLGQWSVLGAWSSSYDAGILDNHVNVDELVEEPSFRHPEGRYVLCTKDKVIEDGDLLEKSMVSGSDPDGEDEEAYTPRVRMSAARYKIRPTEFWGTTLPDEVISPQNRLNGMDSQIIESRLRLGSPNLMMPEDMWPPDGAVTDDSYGSGKIILTRPSVSNPEAQPTIFPSALMSDSVYLERDRTQTDIKRGVGPGDVAGGMAPKNVGTTSGLELLVQQDEQGRALREDALVNCAMKSFSHLNQMQWVLRVDPEVYRVLGPNQTWKYAQYRGAALRGQTEVKIERGAFITKSVLTREAHREALADKLIDIGNPVARRKMREAYGVSGDVNEDTDNQVDQAERQWVDFVDRQIVRVQDSVDDPAIRYAVFQTMLLTEEGQRLTEEAGWDETLRKIAGWEQELKSLIDMEDMSIKFYGGRLVGEEAATAYAKAEMSYQQQEQLYARGQQIAQQIQAQGGVPALSPPPPTPPPPPIEIPVLLQDRIFLVWSGMIEKKKAAEEFKQKMRGQAELQAQGGGGAGLPLAPLQPLQSPSPAPSTKPPIEAGMQKNPTVYMRMRALVEAYKLSMNPAALLPTSATMPPPAPTPISPPPPGTPAGTPAGEPTPPNATAPTGAMPDGGQH